MRATDLASLIVASSGLLGAALAWVTSQRGRRDQSAQQEVANKAQERNDSWKRRGELIEDLQKQSDRDRARADVAETARDRHARRADDAEDELRQLGPLIARHETWDADRVRDQPGVPPAPSLRVPRPRDPAD